MQLFKDESRILGIEHWLFPLTVSWDHSFTFTSLNSHLLIESTRDWNWSRNTDTYSSDKLECVWWYCLDGLSERLSRLKTLWRWYYMCKSPHEYRVFNCFDSICRWHGSWTSGRTDPGEGAGTDRVCVSKSSHHSRHGSVSWWVSVM